MLCLERSRTDVRLALARLVVTSRKGALWGGRPSRACSVARGTWLGYNPMPLADRPTVSIVFLKPRDKNGPGNIHFLHPSERLQLLVTN